MNVTLCLKLPFLRGPLPRGLAPDSFPAPAWPGALRLWPGLPDDLCAVDDAAAPVHSRYRPSNYPFSEREAAVCLADLRQMDVTALSGMPLGAAAAGNARNARQHAELAALKDLDRLGGAASPATEAACRERLEREQAQKTLLWLWLQEERLAELAELARRYADNANRLAAALSVEGDEYPCGLPFLGASIALDPSLVPPWRLAAANAAYFLPEDAALAAEGPMRADLLERLDFSPAPRYAKLLGCTAEHADEIVEARAPLWRALGHSRPPERGADGPLAVERVWLTWGRA
ncbi:hypothetical protein [uncultured Desulfovibrio sp.]|uniref:hypothetical protein n=1 Tax=uncultured Desulfovibrio sp. TaxID=167968 RepID=UPI0003A75973|nr:hypothetical protein [uncultured Desulfovibrio sp.]